MIEEPIKVPAVRIYGGDTVTFPLYLFRDSEGAAMDLSGWTFSAQWRRTPHATASIALDVDVSNVDTGRIVVSADPEMTARMGAGGFWDLQATINDTVKTLIYGKTVFTHDVTR